MVQNFRFKVIDKRQLAKSVFFYVLGLLEPLEIEFKAGQFLNIKISEKMWKPYSICSTPFLKNKIELVVDLTPGGEGSAFFENLGVGEEVLANGPFGTFTVDLPSSKDFGEASDLVFIATGSGIAPIRAMIKDIMMNPAQNLLQAGGFQPRTLEGRLYGVKKITLFFGLRFFSDIYFFEEFEKLEKENPNFKFYGTLSKPEESWRGLSGRVTEHLEKTGDFGNKDYYLCGAPKTVDALKIYLVSCGVNENNIHYEQY